MLESLFGKVTLLLTAVFSLAFMTACADNENPHSPEPVSAGILALSSSSATINGTTGAIVDGDATAPTFLLYYVGDPAPSGYSHVYQWGTPRIVTSSPDEGPVTMSGTIDVDDQVVGQISMIGLLDLDALASGEHASQTGAYIYIYRQTSTQWRIGVTDGNAGGEIVQTFVTVMSADLPADGILDVDFTVDGTADGTTCAVTPPASPSPAGCMTLELSGGSVNSTLSDSYGDVVHANSASPEFANGAIPGWDDRTAAGVVYNLTISPLLVNDPQTRDDCKKGGWEDFGFKNQGQCISFVNTGKDSR